MEEGMKTYNHTTYAILGILTTDCRTGYDIKQLMDQSLQHFWKISYGQIYPTLKNIVKEELATVQTLEQEGKPSRKEYTLTEKGEDVLKTWLHKPIEQIPVERNEILLKLFFGRQQTEENIRSYVIDYQEKLMEQAETYKQIEKVIQDYGRQAGDERYWLMTLDYGKRMTEAAIDWCEATLEQL